MNLSKRLVQRIDFQIAVSIALCMVVFQLAPQLQLLSACTAALMCCQDTGKASFRASITRLVVTLVGGIVAVGIVLLDDLIKNYWIFIPLCAVGLVLTLALCRVCKVPPISGRIGCVTFILVVVVASGPFRISYAVSRLIASLCGAVIATAVSAIFAAAVSKMEPKEPANQA